ncbi:hypothetical protein ACFQZ4_11500 [Catellatospora coxensis]
MSRGQNALVAAGMLGMAGCGVVNVVAAVRADDVDSATGFLAVGVGLAVWCAVWLTLAVRAVAQGVFARPEHLLARGLLRTWRVPWQDLRAIRIAEASHGMGGRYHVPAVDFVVASTPARRGPRELPQRATSSPAVERRTVTFHWLATVTQRRAQRHAERLHLLAVRAGAGLEQG